MRKRLMVIGGGPFQAPLACIGRQREYEVLVIDKDPDCAGRKYADRYEKISLRNKEQALEAAYEFRPDGVCTAGTDFTTTVSWICEGLGLPSNRFTPYETAIEMSNKHIMRKVLETNDILQPSPFRLGENALHPDDEVLYPVIVKPCQSMGSRGVRIVRKKEELPGGIQEAQTYDPKNEVIIEPYIEEARFVSVDSMWLDGRLMFLSTADRLIEVFEGFHPVELGHDVPADLSYQDHQSVLRTMCQIAKAFCYRTGFIKGDLMIKDRRTYVGEVAARVSGSFNSGRTVPLATGFQLHEAVVDIAVGEVDLRRLWLGVDSVGYASERTLVSDVEGIVTGVEVDSVQAREMDTVWVWVKPGDKVRLPRTNVDKVANAIAFGKSRKAAQKKAVRGLGGITIHVKQG